MTRVGHHSTVIGLVGRRRRRRIVSKYIHTDTIPVSATLTILAPFTKGSFLYSHGNWLTALASLW